MEKQANEALTKVESILKNKSRSSVWTIIFKIIEVLLPIFLKKQKKEKSNE